MRRARTVAERQRALRKRRGKSGMLERKVWVHSEDWPVVKALAERLTAEREIERPAPLARGVDRELKG